MKLCKKKIESTDHQIFTKNIYISFLIRWLFCICIFIHSSLDPQPFVGPWPLLHFCNLCRTVWTSVCIFIAVRNAMHFISHENELLDISYKRETTKCRIFQKDILYLSNFLFSQPSLNCRTIHATFHYVSRQSPCRSEDTECAGPTGATRRTITNELTQWSRVLLEMLIVSRLSRNSQRFKEPEGSLTVRQTSPLAPILSCIY
jgi:hypothetical protein